MAATPKTVLYVANAAKIGGGNKVLMDLIQNLDPARYRPLLVAPEAGQLGQWAAAHDVPCVESRAGDWSAAASLARRGLELAWLIRRHRAEVVHASAPMAYRALGLAAYAAGAVRVCHLGFPPEPDELERSFMSGPDAVIGCYNGQADENRRRILAISPSCRVVGIPNGVDITRFAPGPPSAAAAALREGAAVVVAILGHISDVKGYPAFVEAAGRIAAQRADCLFLAIGAETSQPGARAELEARIRERGLEGRFRFLGFRPDVAEVLKAVDIVALPSLAEGFPLAVLEAMSAGCAVVTTPVGGVPEAIIHDRTGLLVEPGDADTLTAALLDLAAAPDRRARLAAAARAAVEDRYSATVFARDVQQLYDDLLAGARGARVRHTAAVF